MTKKGVMSPKGMMSLIEAREYDAVIPAAVSRTPQAAGIQLGGLNQAPDDTATNRKLPERGTRGYDYSQNYQAFPAQLC